MRDAACVLQKYRSTALRHTTHATVAFTQMQGSSASNVIPPSASLVSNIRLNPNDTVDSAVE